MRSNNFSDRETLGNFLTLWQLALLGTCSLGTVAAGKRFKVRNEYFTDRLKGTEKRDLDLVEPDLRVLEGLTNLPEVPVDVVQIPGIGVKLGINRNSL